MPQVRAAVRAKNFRAPHAYAHIVAQRHVTHSNDIPKTRPPRSGFKFSIGRKKWSAARHTMIHAIGSVLIILPAKRRFGTAHATDVVLRGGQLLFPIVP